MASTPVHLGFLTVFQEGTGWLGAYFVTNAWGRPIDFRLSSAVQPNKIQSILYAGTLLPYLCGDLIGKALVDKASVGVQLVVTTCEHALDLRRKLDIPVVYLGPAEESRAASPLVIALKNDRGFLTCHAGFPGDVAAVTGLLAELEGNLDFTEPFNRIRDGVSEARKMGVGNRQAA